MEINIDRIKSRFNGKLLKEDIVKVYNDFKRIDEILKLRLGLEESICKYFRCRLNIGVCFDEISKLNTEIRGYENDIRLLKREEFDEMRQKGILEEFLWSIENDRLDELVLFGCVRSEEVGDIKLERFKRNRDNVSKNYNELNDEGDISRIIM
ncbi:MAG: hypothetical protein H8E55_60190 [Pelagibacterales bacterium]|jgi:hypothetical protein|nr:hypothetical protein [Pelagibacterales bacterium]